jgi:hypothetical protein
MNIVTTPRLPRITLIRVTVRPAGIATLRVLARSLRLPPARHDGAHIGVASSGSGTTNAFSRNETSV